jgi:hypothetical protein
MSNQATNDKKNLRKKIYVNKLIQGRIIFRVFLYWAVYHIVLWHAMFLFRYVEYRGELLAGGRPMPFQELYGSFVLQHYSLAVCAAVVFPIILWDMLCFSHKVAGPLVRFQNVLAQLSRGEPVEKVRLRDGDLLIDFQNSFNAYLESLELFERRTTGQTAAYDLLERLPLSENDGADAADDPAYCTVTR